MVQLLKHTHTEKQSINIRLFQFSRPPHTDAGETWRVATEPEVQTFKLCLICQTFLKSLSIFLWIAVEAIHWKKHWITLWLNWSQPVKSMQPQEQLFVSKGYTPKSLETITLFHEMNHTLYKVAITLWIHTSSLQKCLHCNQGHVMSSQQASLKSLSLQNVNY